MATIGLVSCVSLKGDQAAEARDLYISPLFAKARKYVESRCDAWYILSTKFGLVEPTQVINPYEETLKSKSRAERERWAQRVWSDLSVLVHTGDRIVILAGQTYREHLVPRLIETGCMVEVPMKGLGIGKQLRWLATHASDPRLDLDRDLNRLYCALQALESGLGGKRLLSECTGRQKWPRNGIYFFFEPEEFRSKTKRSRIVRVGTHGVSRGSKATLWNRLRTHRGTSNGLGNHRSSIFRMHVGAAISARDRNLRVPSWGKDQVASSNVRKKERQIERAVSKYIGAMSVLWLAIDDEAGPMSDRAYIERNAIGLLVGRAGPLDPPSANWLGNLSPDERIRKSGLWNLAFLDYSYANKFLDALDEYVLITVGEKPQPTRSLAPPHWYDDERRGISHNQLSLFGE